MLDLAAQRITDNGWRNMHLINAPVDRAVIDGAADAALFCAVHDVMQNPAAIVNIVNHLRPRAAVAAIGGKWPAPWRWPLRAWVADLHAPFITDFTGFDQPWKHLAQNVPDLKIQTTRPRHRLPRPRAHPRPLTTCLGQRTGIGNRRTNSGCPTRHFRRKSQRDAVVQNTLHQIRFVAGQVGNNPFRHLRHLLPRLRYIR